MRKIKLEPMIKQPRGMSDATLAIVFIVLAVACAASFFTAVVRFEAYLDYQAQEARV